jgi:glucosamine-6-phosphate deaminase
MRFQGVHAYSIWFPWPSDPPEYDRRIAEAGGIDFFLLASGASDGHVGFNSPGAPSESHTRIVELSEQTRRDNLRTFPAFGTIDNVPRHGITVGIATLAAAREAVMVVWGADKRLTLKRILAADRYDPAWPATVIHACARREITCDADAASVLPARPQFPARPAAP